MPVFFFWEPYTPENTLSANHLITLPVFPTQSRFDTSLLSGGVEDSPKMFFFLQTIFAVKEIFAQFHSLKCSSGNEFVSKRPGFTFFRLPDFGVLGRETA